jgi:hypothetical protein
MAGRGRPRKDPFQDLDQAWKDAITGMSPDEIKKKVSEVAIELSRIIQAKKEDEDLKAKMIEAKEAGAVYRDGQKMALLRIKFAKQTLEDKGKI